MSKHGVVVYGASGYTGKLICWHLAQAGIAFTAAGRNAERLQEQMDLVPELAGAEYECRAVDRTVEDLAELFAGSKVVVNVTGPFMQIGEPVVQAALQAGCHYLDTTGEQDWITHIRDEYGEAFANKGLLLAPATSYMFVMGAMAAEIALETPGIDTLDIAYLADTMTSVASTKSFLRMCTKPQYFLEQNELVMWPYATPYDIRVPDSNRIFRALPWSGGAEPLWFRDDPRVRNCSVLIGFRSQAMFGAVIDTLRNFEQEHRHKTPEEQEEVTNALGGTITSEEPPREHPDRNRSVISCIGRGNTNGVSVVLRGNSPYFQTAEVVVESCRQLLAGAPRAVGFQAATTAFGARNLMNALVELGYQSAQVDVV